MLRISKLTDYALVLIAELSSCPTLEPVAATDLAARTELPLPTVAKVLKLLAAGGIVGSARGKSGGYRLLRDPATLGLLEVIDAIEGELGLTDCSVGAEHCERGTRCRLRAGFQRLNAEVRTLFARVRVSELLAPTGASGNEPDVAVHAVRRDRAPALA